jgi:hypothetical protein
MIENIFDETEQQHEVVKFTNNNDEYTKMASMFNASRVTDNKETEILIAFHNEGPILEPYNS